MAIPSLFIGPPPEPNCPRGLDPFPPLPDAALKLTSINVDKRADPHSCVAATPENLPLQISMGSYIIIHIAASAARKSQNPRADSYYEVSSHQLSNHENRDDGQSKHRSGSLEVRRSNCAEGDKRLPPGLGLLLAAFELATRMHAVTSLFLGRD